MAVDKDEANRLARRETERELARERELLRITLASIGDAVISTDAAGRVTFLNAVAETLTGWTQAEAVGQPLPEVFRIVNEQTRQPAENPALRALREGVIVGLANHTILIAKDGTERPIDDSAAPIRDGDHAPVGAVLVFRDVTERKRIEDSLRESEAQFRQLAETIPQLAWMAQPDGHIFWYNRRWYDYTGTTPQEMEGWGWAKVHDPDELPKVLEQWQGSIATGEPFDMVFPLRGRDGEFRPFLTLVNPLTGADGRVTLWFGTNTDLSVQKRAETTLRESEQRFHMLADSVPVHVWMDDERGRSVFANARYIEYTGLTAEVLLVDAWPDVVHTDDRERYRAEYAAATAARAEHRVEVRLRRRDGEYRWFEVIGRPRFEGERFAGYVGISLDVTDRRQAQQSLREADRRKDDFLAILAHELRNPLAPIRNGLQVLRLAEERKVRERTQTMMDRQLSHMVRLIDDLLDVSRISRNKMELRREPILLADVVASAVETARPLIDAAGHRLEIQLPPDPIYLDADLTRLAQVFSNLLTNSAKYMDPGGSIRLSAEARGETVAVAVRDTGVGIPAEALPAIFDMFSQVDRSIERSQGGLGIGLALVKGLVEMHGGTIAARSDGHGLGSTFEVVLPTLARRAGPVAAGGTEDDLPSAVGRRILVVDDNRDAAASMAIMLELLGEKVRTAHDGLEAIEVADAYRPEVILMDIGMPRLNGFEATRRIREQPWGRAMAIVALTGWGQDGDRALSKEAGCDGHLVKPVSLADLQKLLRGIAAGGGP